MSGEHTSILASCLLSVTGAGGPPLRASVPPPRGLHGCVLSPEVGTHHAPRPWARPVRGHGPCAELCRPPSLPAACLHVPPADPSRTTWHSLGFSLLTAALSFRFLAPRRGPWVLSLTGRLLPFLASPPSSQASQASAVCSALPSSRGWAQLLVGAPAPGPLPSCPQLPHWFPPETPVLAGRARLFSLLPCPHTVACTRPFPRNAFPAPLF